MDGINAYTCACPLGYEGTYCENGTNELPLACRDDCSHSRLGLPALAAPVVCPPNICGRNGTCVLEGRNLYCVWSVGSFLLPYCSAAQGLTRCRSSADPCSDKGFVGEACGYRPTELIALLPDNAPLEGGPTLCAHCSPLCCSSLVSLRCCCTPRRHDSEHDRALPSRSLLCARGRKRGRHHSIHALLLAAFGPVAAHGGGGRQRNLYESSCFRLGADRAPDSDHFLCFPYSSQRT